MTLSLIELIGITEYYILYIECTTEYGWLGYRAYSTRVSLDIIISDLNPKLQTYIGY